MFHLRFGLSDHLKALLDFVFGSRRRVKKVRIFRAWFSQEMDRLRGRQLPTIDFNITSALNRVLARDRAREVSRV